MHYMTAVSLEMSDEPVFFVLKWKSINFSLYIYYLAMLYGEAYAYRFSQRRIFL